MAELFDNSKNAVADIASPLPAKLYRSLLKIRFNGELEPSFQYFYAERNVRFLRIAFIGAVLIFLIYGVLDMVLLGREPNKIFLLRYWIGAPVLGVVCCLAFSRLILRFQQLILVAGVTLFCTLLLLMMFLVPPVAAQIYFCGFLIAIMTGLTLLRMQFAYVLFSGLSIICLFLASANYFGLSGPEFILDTSLVFSAISVCWLASYFNERASRKDFIQKHLINIKQIELEKMNHELKQLAENDGLTGVANRRRFDDCLKEEWRRALREQYPIALLMIDIDFFKHYNDAYGHQKGDSCLKEIAANLKSYAKRPGDLAARYGGEEFAIILPHLNLEQACALGREICHRIAGLNIEHLASPLTNVVTVSIGAASVIPGSNILQESLIEASDQALYQSKGAGRNRCTGVSLTSTFSNQSIA